MGILGFKEETLQYFTSYLSKLILNKDKKKFLILSKNNTTKSKLHLTAVPDNIQPISHFKFLGITVPDNLHWSNYLIEKKIVY